MTAVVGLVGVVVGALVTGVLEWLRTTRDERYERIAAVRLTCSDLHKVLAVTEEVALTGRWGAESDPLPMGGYSQHASSLARRLDSEQWKWLEGAILGIGRLELIRRDLVEEDREATSKEGADLRRIRAHIKDTLAELDEEAWAIRAPVEH